MIVLMLDTGRSGGCWVIALYGVFIQWSTAYPGQARSGSPNLFWAVFTRPDGIRHNAGFVFFSKLPFNHRVQSLSEPNSILTIKCAFSPQLIRGRVAFYIIGNRGHP